MQAGHIVFRSVAAAACAVVFATAGCTSADEATRSADAPVRRAPGGQSLHEVALPDLAQMTASAAAQLRQQYFVLTQRIENTATPAGELAVAYGEMGKLFMAADYPDGAESCFLNAQALAATDARWPYYLAHLYRDGGQLEKALPLFEQVLRLQPGDVAAMVWLGDVQLAQGQPDRAEPHFARALSIQPSSLSARFGLGRVALAKGDFPRAVQHLEEILAKDPQAAGAHYPLAMAYRGLGDMDKAEAHIRLREDHEILPADPLMVELEELLESPQAYERRGIRALDQEDWDEAMALFRKGLEIEPGNPSLRHRLGTALFMKGDARGARAQFEQVVRESPDHYMAQYSLGVLLQAEGRHADAVERFSAALQTRPSYNEARLRLVTSLRRTGRAKESLPHYDQILAVTPDLVEARFGRAMALVQLGRYREARDRLAEGMKAHPQQPVFAHGLARVLAAAPDDRVRDGQRAMALVQDLLKAGRTLDLGETMAMTMAELGHYAQAANVQRELMTAAQNAGLQGVVARLAANLARYERGEPCRTPWTDADIP
jgi:tetratricopeptide (TPR) repeat protein